MAQPRRAGGSARGRPKDELEGVGTFIAAIGVTVGSLRYFLERREARRKEQGQRRDMLEAQWEALVSGERCALVIQMLEDDHADLQKLGPGLSSGEYQEWKHGLDQMFGLLLRFAFAVNSGEIEEDAAHETAGWYFHKVATHDAIRQYCSKHGYGPLVTFAVAATQKAKAKA